MAQSLGSLYVDLTAETGGFVSALSKAAAAAQQTSKEISRSFGELREVAEQTFGAFGEFNPAISKISFALESAGSAASSMMKQLSGIGGILGPLAALGTGAAVGLAALGAGAIGVAVDASESAAKMYELSRATGVSVESLSALSFAAKQSGVDQQALAKSLEILSANMLKAAEAPAGAATAFSRLGLSIRQQNGDLKDAGVFLVELLKHLDEMKDKTAAVGFARQALGRGGAQLLAIDPGELDHWIEVSQKLGVTLTGQVAEAAEKFQQTLGEIGAAVHGAANVLMAELLPALTAVAEAIVSAIADSGSALVQFITFVADSIKGTLAVFDTLYSGIKQIALSIAFALEEIGTPLVGVYKSIALAITGHFADAASEMKTTLDDMIGYERSAAQKSGQIWSDNSAFINKVYGGLPPPKPARPRLPGEESEATAAKGSLAGGRLDVVAQLIEQLQAQATAELALAAATEKSASASALAKAAAEADVKIAETRAKLLAQEKQLRDQLSNTQSQASAGAAVKGTEPAVPGAAGAAARAPRIQAQIEGVQKLLAELDKDTPLIKTLYEEIAGGKFGVTASEDLEKFITKTDEETTALQKMAAAYQQGPLAAQQAAEGAKIAPFEKKRADLGEIVGGLTDKRDALQKAGGDPALIAELSAAIAPLTTAYNELGAAIDRAKVSETAFVAAEISEKIAKEKALLASEAEGFRLVAAAALKSAADQREAAAEAAALKFGAEHRTATPSQLGEVRDTELAKLTQQRAETIATAAAQFDLNASYAQELEKLQEIKAFLEASGESTIAIDTKIYETRISHLLDYQRQVFESDNQQLLGEAKIYETSIQLTEQWDKAALEVGSLGDKFKAVSNEIQLEGQNLGANLAQDFKGAMDDASSSLAKFIVTGKGSIREFFDSFAEKALDSTFKYTFSQIFAGITGPAGGAASSSGPLGGLAGGVGPGGTAGTFPGPLGGLAGALGIKVPSVPGALGAIGAHAPSSVATMNIAAQVVNLSGSFSGSGAAAAGGAPVSSTGNFPGFGLPGPASGAADGSSSAPWYSIFTDSTGNPYGVGNALPIVPSGGGSPFTEALPITGADNQRAFAASSIFGLPGPPGGAGAPGANPSLLTSVAGGAGLGGANGTATSPFYVVSALGPLGGLSSGTGGSPLGSVPGQDVYGNAVFGSGAAAPGAAPASGAAGGFIGTILKLFGIGASTSSPGGGAGGGIGGAVGGAGGAASSTAAATTMQAAATTMVTAATTMTTAAATMQSAAATMSASAGSSGGGGGLFGGLGDLFGGGGGAGDASELGDFADFADLAAFSTGGRVTKGVPYIVGEDRPEVFVPDEHGKIVRSLPDFASSSTARDMKLAGMSFADISHRESGGSVTAGMPYLTGERRPEVFVPNSFSSSAPRGRGGDTHHYQNTVIQNIHTPDADSFRKSQDQLHAEAFAAMNRASYRNG